MRGKQQIDRYISTWLTAVASLPSSLQSTPTHRHLARLLLFVLSFAFTSVFTFAIIFVHLLLFNRSSLVYPYHMNLLLFTNRFPF